jgi:ribulose-phosphate 3-epimerase
MRAERRASFRIEIDGGIGNDTVAEAVRAGVEILVAGNAVFGSGSPKENAQRLLRMAQEATLQRV